MAGGSFENSFFINCPFDKDYEPILQSILFAVIYLGFEPRLASESNDSGAVRLEKIRGLIEASKYSIHDLSRCQAKKKGEHYRLNMPFELGIDYGCRQYFGDGRESKKLLILEEKLFRYQAAISDLAGCDIKPTLAISRMQFDKSETGSLVKRGLTQMVRRELLAPTWIFRNGTMKSS